MAIHCPHCEKPMDCRAETRFGGNRWHTECWIPWLEARLESARAQEAKYQHATEQFEAEAAKYRGMISRFSSADRKYTEGKLRCD